MVASEVQGLVRWVKKGSFTGKKGHLRSHEPTIQRYQFFGQCLQHLTAIYTHLYPLSKQQFLAGSAATVSEIPKNGPPQKSSFSIETEIGYGSIPIKSYR